MSTRKARPAGRKVKRVYFFGDGVAEGNRDMKPLLGGKGANLADMTSIGLPVPPGFTITTAVCDGYYKNGRKLPAGLMDEVKKSIAMLEKLVAFDTVFACSGTCRPPTTIVADSWHAEVRMAASRTAFMNRSAAIRMEPGPQSFRMMPNLFEE